MLKGFVRYHKLSISILIFLILFSIIHMMKPTMLYNDDGSFRQFGVGYRHKTVIPIWGVSMVIAIFSYMSVMYYLAYM
jgi:uncharacterized membrane protein YidH (DUF202 family)